MSSLTFDRYSGNVPVIDANTGIIIAPSFTPLFRRDSFQLAGLLTSLTGPGAYFFTPSEIIAINSACALIRADKTHMQGELVYTGREPFATLGEISACSPDGMLLGALDSITIDSATGMPVSFSTGAGRGIAPAYPQTPRMNPMAAIGQPAQPWMPQTGWPQYSQQPVQTWRAPAFQQPAYQPQPAWNPMPAAEMPKAPAAACEPETTAPQPEPKEESLPEKKTSETAPEPVRISVQFTPEQQQEIDAIIRSLSQRNEIAQAKMQEAEQKAAEAEEKALLAEARVEEARRLAEEAKRLSEQAEAAKNIAAEEPAPACEDESTDLPYEEDDDGPVPTIDWLLAQKQAPAETEDAPRSEEAPQPAEEYLNAPQHEEPQESETEEVFADEALNGPLPQEIISKEAADAGWRPPVDLEKDNCKEASGIEEVPQKEAEEEQAPVKACDTYYDTISPEEFFKQIEGLLEPVKPEEEVFPDEALNGPLPQEPQVLKAEKPETEGITGPRLSFVLTSQLLEEEAEKQAKASDELTQLAEKLSQAAETAEPEPREEVKEPEEPQTEAGEEPQAETPQAAADEPAEEAPQTKEDQPAAEEPVREPEPQAEESAPVESGIDYETENANYRKQLRTRNLAQILGMILLAGSIAIATML